MPGKINKLYIKRSNVERLRLRQNLEKLEFNNNNNKRLICYITSWSMYRKSNGKFVPENIDQRLCTDIVYAFASLNPKTLVIQPFDTWADIDNSKLLFNFMLLLTIYYYLRH